MKTTSKAQKEAKTATPSRASGSEMKTMIAVMKALRTISAVSNLDKKTDRQAGSVCVRVCVCERERERERESLIICVKEKDRESAPA